MFRRDLRLQRTRLLRDQHGAGVAGNAGQGTQSLGPQLRVRGVLHLAHQPLDLGQEERKHLNLQARIAARVAIELRGVEEAGIAAAGGGLGIK